MKVLCVKHIARCARFGVFYQTHYLIISKTNQRDDVCERDKQRHTSTKEVASTEEDHQNKLLVTCYLITFRTVTFSLCIAPVFAAHMSRWSSRW